MKRVAVRVMVPFLAVGLGLVIYLVWVKLRAPLRKESQRIFEVQYVWDQGLRSLVIIDAKTGAEETDSKWRQRVAALAEREVPKIVESAGLSRATGRFYADTWDDEARYLPRWGLPSDPELARDPDVTPLSRFEAFL